MKYIRKIVKKIWSYLFTKERLMHKLESADDYTLKSVVNALRNVLNYIILDAEKDWVEKIELIRKDLLNSKKVITIEDYGAHAPNLNLTEEDMYKGKILKKTVGEATKSSISNNKGFLLFKLIRELKPSLCLELGTALGISASFQLAALEMNNKGRLITIEGAKSVAEIARENFKKLGLPRISVRIGKFQDILELVVNEIKPIDFVFIDGHHDKDATLNYFEKIYPSLSDKAILVFDDIRWSKGMKQAWKTLVKDIRIKFTIDLIEFGICIISNSNIKKQRFKLIIKKD